MEKAEPSTTQVKPSFLDQWADQFLKTTQPTVSAAPLNQSQSTPVAAPSTTPTPQPTTTATTPAQNQIRDYHGLQEFAEGQDFTVTSTTGGTHNVGSVHSSGCAVDVRTRDKTPEEVEEMITSARDQGITVRDERTRPAGQAVWSGPHVHLQVPPENRQANGTCFDLPTAQPTPAQGPAIRP